MRIILVGFGVVGQSLARVLMRYKSALLKNYGFNPRVVAIVDKTGACTDPSGLDLERILEVKERKGSVSADPVAGKKGRTVKDIVEQTDCEVVVETTPSNFIDGEPGLSNIKTALKCKKHVVTTNKGPLALALPALMELADFNGVMMRFSGTVGGGTPVLDFAKKCIIGDRIHSVRGILNGTTNYILTRMAKEGVEMPYALKEAQKAGYAEADPSHDIDGVDTASKLVIIANWVMERRISLPEVQITGIRGVELSEVAAAVKQGKEIKLIGSIDEGGRAKVEPTLISRDHPLCVSGTLNAITINTELVGDITLVGKGAGGSETASAALRDLIGIREYLTL